MKFLQVDSPLMEGLGKFADLIIINFYTLLLCIPIVTAGAAFTAMHYVCLKIVRGEEVYVTKQYFHSFKVNFAQSTVIWLIILFVALFFGFDFYLLGAAVNQFSKFVGIGLLVAIILLSFGVVMVFAVQAKFCNPIFNTFKMAYVIALVQFPKTFVVLVLSVIPFLLAFRFFGIFPLLMCLAFSGPAYVSALFYNKTFKRLEDKYRADHGIELPPDEDEHIFSDEPLFGEENAQGSDAD